MMQWAILSQIIVVGIPGEAILIGLHLRNIHKEDGVLSAVFCFLKEWRKPSCEEDTQLSITALLRAIR
jgi:hypothetical protein